MTWEAFLFYYNIHLPSNVIDMVCGELNAHYSVHVVYRDESYVSEYTGKVKYKVHHKQKSLYLVEFLVTYVDGYVEDIEFVFEYLNQQELYSEFITNLNSIISKQMEKYLLEIFKIKDTTNEYENSI